MCTEQVVTATNPSVIVMQATHHYSQRMINHTRSCIPTSGGLSLRLHTQQAPPSGQVHRKRRNNRKRRIAQLGTGCNPIKASYVSPQSSRLSPRWWCQFVGNFPSVFPALSHWSTQSFNVDGKRKGSRNIRTTRPLPSGAPSSQGDYWRRRFRKPGRPSNDIGP